MIASKCRLVQEATFHEEIMIRDHSLITDSESDWFNQDAWVGSCGSTDHYHNLVNLQAKRACMFQIRDMDVYVPEILKWS